MMITHGELQSNIGVRSYFIKCNDRIMQAEETLHTTERTDRPCWNWERDRPYAY